jgi:excinuclease ABC subunit C
MLRVLPSEPGVYRFRNSRATVLYVGRAGQLRSRVASYWSDLGDRRHLSRMVAAVAQIEAVVCASRHEAAWLERNLLEASMPRWNRTAGGQEKPVVIALDGRPSTPQLRVAHLPVVAIGSVEIFGPYLGGLQVRRAVAGLHRIYPLAYSGSRLSGAGRAMATGRGVGETDRDSLVETITSVLNGEPAAVSQTHRALEMVRERAAAAEAFELAGRVHAELQALDWVTSTQRVTSLHSDDATISGWSDGLLVEFGVRAGILCTWTARRCDQSSAAPHLAATPDAWRGFAQFNADLAAALDDSRQEEIEV